MAKIDEGSFGTLVRPAVPQTVATPASTFDSSGIESFGRSIAGLGEAQFDRQRVERHQEQMAFKHSQTILDEKVKEENRARSAAALVDYDLAVKEAGYSVADQLHSGQIERDQVGPKFQEAEAKLRQATMKQIPVDQQEFIAPRLAKSAERVQWGLGQVVEQHRKSTIVGYADQMRDTMAKMAVEPDADLPALHRDFASAAAILYRDGGKNPRDVAKIIQDFKDQSTADHLVARLNDNLDNLDGLYELKKQILGPSGDISKQFNTPLTAAEQAKFVEWKKKYAPNDSGADYDLQGAFLAGLKPGSDGHWPDTFKKPNHPTFSDESVYAKFGRPGKWVDGEFVPPTGPGKSYYSDLDPNKRNVIVHSINGAIDRLEGRLRADADRVLAELATDMSNTEKAMMEGYPASAEQMLSLGKRAQGTPLADHFARLDQTNAYISKWQGASVGQMEGELLRLDSEVRKKPSPEGISMVHSLRQLLSDKQKNLVDDPYAQVVKDGAPFTPIDFTNAKSLDATIRSRVVAVLAQAKTNPGSSKGIFLEGDVRAFSEFVATQPPARTAELLGTISKAIADPVVAAHSMGQISKQAPMLAEAGMIASWGDLPTATAILEGEQLLNGKGKSEGPMSMPSEDKFRDGWRSRAGNAYQGKPDAEKQSFEAARAIYAALARRAGKSADKEVNGSLWRQAIDMATGGIAEHNGQDIVLPRGVDEGEFRRRAHAAIDMAYNSREIAGAGIPGNVNVDIGGDTNLTTEQRYKREYQRKAEATGQTAGINTEPIPKAGGDTVRAGQLTRDYLKDLPLETIGMGQYKVVSGKSYVQNDAGHPLILDLRRPTPAYRWDDRTVISPVRYEGGGTDFLGRPLDTSAVRGMGPQDQVTGTPLGRNSETSIEMSPDTAAPLSKSQMKRDRKAAD